MNKVLKDFLWPVVILVALTALIQVTGLDLYLEGRFFQTGTGWVYGDHNPWIFLYNYGVFPSLLLASGALLAVVASLFSARFYIYRKCALFFLLLMLLGPGLMVNTVLKDHWGRPRPRQMQVFGGASSFHQVWERCQGRMAGTSFPSGHASAAFYLMAPYFVWRQSSRRKARIFLSAGIGYGLLMGVARMVQGGHFPSDILWAGGVVYLVGLSLYYLLRLDRGVLLVPKAVPRRLPVTAEPTE
ncbi:MAG TPA: phosphatase PAP2 family protein [Geomonas sp.]|nr:phosphatase PAP2 family protein [Geomonas sp.]